jgi:hypothetical protein
VRLHGYRVVVPRRVAIAWYRRFPWTSWRLMLYVPNLITSYTLIHSLLPARFLWSICWLSECTELGNSRSRLRDSVIRAWQGVKPTLLYVRPSC